MHSYFDYFTIKKDTSIYGIVSGCLSMLCLFLSIISWKTECFGLTVATLIDKCSDIEYIGGTYGSNRIPTPFICLLLKLLQINPEFSIVKELLNDTTNKYLRALISIYIRIAFRPIDIYQLLEPILKDYRKLRHRLNTTWTIMALAWRTSEHIISELKKQNI